MELWYEIFWDFRVIYWVLVFGYFVIVKLFIVYGVDFSSIIGFGLLVVYLVVFIFYFLIVEYFFDVFEDKWFEWFENE